jgi:hypothetical protein
MSRCYTRLIRENTSLGKKINHRGLTTPFAIFPDKLEHRITAALNTLSDHNTSANLAAGGGVELVAHSHGRQPTLG